MQTGVFICAEQKCRSIPELLMLLSGSGLFTGIAIQIASAATAMLGPIMPGTAGFYRKLRITSL